MKISRISSLVTPLTRAALICTRNSCGRFRIEIIARLSMLRVLRGNSSRPQTAPQQVFGDQFLKRLVEIVGLLERLPDGGLAQHGFTNFQPLVVRFLVHTLSRTSLMVRS